MKELTSGATPTLVSQAATPSASPLIDIAKKLRREDDKSDASSRYASPLVSMSLGLKKSCDFIISWFHDFVRYCLGKQRRLGSLCSEAVPQLVIRQIKQTNEVDPEVTAPMVSTRSRVLTITAISDRGWYRIFFSCIVSY